MFFNKKKKEEEQEVIELLDESNQRPRMQIQEEVQTEDLKPIDVTNGSVQTIDVSLVWDALRECYDPEIPVNIVDLGLVYDLKVQENFLYIKMTLTAPGCGMGPQIASDVRRRALQVPGVRDAKIDIVFTPPWDTTKMTDQAKLILNIP